MRFGYTTMDSAREIARTSDENKGNNEKLPAGSRTPGDMCSNSISRTPPTKALDSYWFAHSGDDESSPANVSKSPNDLKDLQLQKEKEERIRHFREQQEEDRVKRLKELEQSFVMAKKHREHQEQERRRKIEEARVKETERRQQVEERKRQIWEAEQERKEAILRRNMEREARIEARRNAQRNSQCFAFGSSTPRTFDLDLAAIGLGRNVGQGSVLMSSVSGRRSEDRDLGPPRATSACSLDRKCEDSFASDDCLSHGYEYRASSLEPNIDRFSLAKQISLQQNSSNDMKACLSMWDGNISSHYQSSNFFDRSCGWLVGSGVIVGEDYMSRSMVSLSSTFRGRRRTDITPTPTRDRSVTPHSTTPRGNYSMRAVSMTRLDQLAQPRKSYLNAVRGYSGATTTPVRGPGTTSPSMSKSMCNLANPTARKFHPPFSSRGPSGGNMSRSMLQLPGAPPAPRDSRRFTPSPTLPPKPTMRPARSMVSLAPVPRLTRAARLRAMAGANAKSAWNLSRAEDGSMARQNLSPGKDSPHSPSRPQSSMSGTSEMSATSSSVSAVNMRPRTAPRRPRPYSIAGCAVDNKPTTAASNKELERQPRLAERNVSPPKPLRNRSSAREKESDNVKPTTVAKKPLPPPKSSEVLARAKIHNVPIKDNLRKVPKANPEKTLVNGAGKEVIAAKKKSVVEQIPSNSTVDQKDRPRDSIEQQSSNVIENNQDSVPVHDSVITTPESSPPLQVGSNLAQNESVDSKPSVTELHVEATNQSPEVSTADNPPVEILNVESKETVKGEIKVEQRDQQQIAVVSQSDVSNGDVKEAVAGKTRITSEEEAKAALAEKRRLAREQAEREAELERQRLDEIRRQEEEQRRLEELEQQRMEAEQIRLAELHRKLEEEKLQKAIEEQEQREREERERKEEEARQKAEREEQERKAREEAEKQRIELEERLRKEEEERAERKRRVEQIMARTRKSQQAASSPQSETSRTNSVSNASNKVPPMADSITPSKAEGSAIVFSATQNQSDRPSFPCDVTLSEKGPLPDLLGSQLVGDSRVENGHSEQNGVNVLNNFSLTAQKFAGANGMTSPTQTNGYSSHEEMSCTTSPEDVSDGPVLISVDSKDVSNVKSPNSQSADFMLVDYGETTTTTNYSNENYLINVDNINSNVKNSASPFIEFEDSVQKKQEQPVVDLLS